MQAQATAFTWPHTFLTCVHVHTPSQTLMRDTHACLYVHARAHTHTHTHTQKERERLSTFSHETRRKYLLNTAGVFLNGKL